MKTEEAKISKFLSLVLRHKPETIGVTLDSAGWISVEELLAAAASHGTKISIAELRSVVENNDKKRFAFSDDGKMIRASQGHSLDVELGYEAAVPPALLYHGTADRFLPSIMKEGLDKRARTHVHLTESIDTAITVGSRYGKVILLHIDAARMHIDGHEFFLSANKVWLTDHVPVSYIQNRAKD